MKFLICGTPRTGSNLLISLMKSVYPFGEVTEHFNIGNIKGYYGISEDMFALLSDSQICEIVDKEFWCREKDGIWGCKVFLEHLHFLHRYLKIGFHSWDMFKVIWLRRRDVIRQSISQEKYRRTKRGYISNDNVRQASIEESEYSDSIDFQSLCNKIRDDFRWQMLNDYAWGYYFDVHNVTPYIVYYEDFEDLSNQDEIVKGVLDFLEIPYQQPLETSTTLKKQSTELNNLIYEYIMDKTLKAQNVFLEETL